MGIKEFNSWQYRSRRREEAESLETLGSPSASLRRRLLRKRIVRDGSSGDNPGIDGPIRSGIPGTSILERALRGGCQPIRQGRVWLGDSPQRKGPARYCIGRKAQRAGRYGRPKSCRGMKAATLLGCVTKIEN